MLWEELIWTQIEQNRQEGSVVVSHPVRPALSFLAKDLLSSGKRSITSKERGAI